MTQPTFGVPEPQDQFNQQLAANTGSSDWSNPSPEGRYNLVVVGGGTAGLVTAAIAANLGARTALIERNLLGGDCLVSGCVPSKSLLSVARQIRNVRDSGRLGLQAALESPDFAGIMKRMRRHRAEISVHDSAKRFSGMGVDVYFGQAEFRGPKQIAVGDRLLHFRKACIATGGHPVVPAIDGIKDVRFLTNESLFSLTRLPKRLVIVGGGPIGTEMAQCFALFGSQVTILERNDRILSQDDPQAAEVIQDSLLADGVAARMGCQIRQLSQVGQEISIQLDGASQESRAEESLVCDEVLFAAGREPNCEGLGLEQANVEYDSRNGIRIDDRFRTTNRSIYAAGDVASSIRFTHAADFMARAVVQNALFPGFKKRLSRMLVPHVTYTSPELAHIGLNEKEATAAGKKFDALFLPFSEIDRAILDSQTSGFVKILVRKRSDRILGATIVGNGAGDWISEIGVAMNNRLGLHRIGSTIHPYPTYAEAIRKLGDQLSRLRFSGWKKGMLRRYFRWFR